MRTIKGVVMKRIYLVLFLFAFSYTFADNIDYLQLSGKIKKIKDNYVTVIVESGSCKGERKFKISPKIKHELEKNTVITFQINSEYCKKKDENLKIIKIINKMKIK
jgi:hypothetical protein